MPERSLVQVTIEDMTWEGQGVAHLREGTRLGEEGDAQAMPLDHPDYGMTLFVQGGLLGDRVLCQIQERKKRYLKGQAIRLLQGEKRRDLPGDLAREAESYRSAMPLLPLRAEAQVAWKKRLLASSLEHLGSASFRSEALGSEGAGKDRILLPDSIPLTVGPEFSYRNKVNLRLNPDGRLALSEQKSNQRIPIDAFPLACPVIEKSIHSWNQQANKDPHFSNLVKDLKMVVFRSNTKGEQMVSLLAQKPWKASERKALFSALDFLSAKVLALYTNPRPGDDRFLGPGYFASEAQALPMELSGYHFQLSPKSFFQVNRFLTEKLYDHALSLLDPSLGEKVLDLYCGIGTTTLLLGQRGFQALGVEIVPDAVEDAKANAKRNGISGLSFLCGPAEELIADLAQEEKAYRQILVDPPRKGLDKKVRSAIAQSPAKRLVYVSCNPASLARDLQDLTGQGFSVDHLEAFDFFPNTGHLETIVGLRR